MKKITRIKAAAGPAAPQTKDECVEAIAEIGRKQRERDRIQADMNDELAAIKQKYETLALPLADTIRVLTSGVQTWCEANRDALTNGGKVKFAALASGEIKWRMRPPSIRLKGADAIMELMRKLGLSRFIRVKEEVNKDALLAEPDVAKNIPGVTISQTEDFVIIPFETELEEVAA